MDNINEIWEPVVGYKGLYEVSCLGKVRTLTYKGTTILKEGRLLSPGHVGGYRQVHLYKNRIKTSKLVHVLVAQSFILNPENKPKVNHKDGEKANNHVENLEWCTQLENIHHSMYILGKTYHGSKHHHAKLTEEIITKMKEMHRDYPAMKNRDIAKVFGIWESNMSWILAGKVWKHVKI